MKSCVFHFMSMDEHLIRQVAQRASEVDGSEEKWWQGQVRHPSPSDPRWSIEIEATDDGMDDELLDVCIKEIIGHAEWVEAKLYPQRGE